MDIFPAMGYECFVLNLRGHGDDRKFKKSFKLSGYIEDVTRCVEYCRQYCKKNGLTESNPFIIGHSMGGGLVQLYISSNSNQVKGAVMFAPATAGGLGFSEMMASSWSESGRCTSRTLFFGHNRIQWLKYSNFFGAIREGETIEPRVTNEDDLDHYNSQLCRESIGAVFGLCRYKLNGGVHIPVLVIGSDTDAYFQEKSLKKTADFYHTQPKILKGLCHDMMLDEKGWRDSAQEVLNFIEQQ